MMPDYCVDCGCPLDVCCGHKMPNVSSFWLKDFAKYRKQGFQAHHFHMLFADLPILERDKQCLLTWNEVRNIMREMRDEPVETKSSCEIMHEYGHQQTKKFLCLAKGDKKKAFKLWLLDEFRPEKGRKEGVAYFGGFKAKTKEAGK
jgi:hypothetical protein